MQINSCGVAGAQNVLFEVREQAVCAMARGQVKSSCVPQPEIQRFDVVYLSKFSISVGENANAMQEEGERWTRS